MKSILIFALFLGTTASAAMITSGPYKLLGCISEKPELGVEVFGMVEDSESFNIVLNSSSGKQLYKAERTPSKEKQYVFSAPATGGKIILEIGSISSASSQDSKLISRSLGRVNTINLQCALPRKLR
jgi:hypothetical protein